MRDRRVRTAFLGLILAFPLLIHAATPDMGQATSATVAPPLGLELGPFPTWLVLGEAVVILGLIFVAHQRRLLVGLTFRSGGNANAGLFRRG